MLEQKLRTILEEKENKIIPSNIKKGVTIFDVEGTLETGGGSGPIKLYSSKEEMMADTTEPDNEYGVVYMNKIQEVQEGQKASSFVFPKTVVLNSAVTDGIWGSFRSEDRMGDLSFNADPNNARVSVYTGDSWFDINYTTEDAITYTTDSEYADTPIDLGVEILFEARYEPWNNIYGKFIQAGGMYLEGMYEWKDEKDTEWFDTVRDMSVDMTDKIISGINEEMYFPRLEELSKEELQILVDDNSASWIIVKYPDETYHALGYRNSSFAGVLVDKDGNMYVGSQYRFGEEEIPDYIYDVLIDIEHNTLTVQEPISSEYHFKYESYGEVKECNAIKLPMGTIFINYHKSTWSSEYVKFDFINLSNLTVEQDYSNDFSIGHISFQTWHHVKTEFNLSNEGQLLPGITALGKHGPVTGNETIYDNISINAIVDRHIGMETLPSDVYNIDTDDTPGSMLLYMNKRNDLLKYNLHRQADTGITNFVNSLGHTLVEAIVLYVNESNVYYLCACDIADDNGGYRLLTIKYNKGDEFTLLYDSVNTIIYNASSSIGVCPFTYNNHTLCISTNKTAAILDIDLITGEITVLDDAINEYASINGTSMYVNNIQNGCVVDNAAYLIMHKRLAKYNFDTKTFDWNVGIINSDASASTSTYFTNWFEYKGHKSIVILAEKLNYDIILVTFDSNTSVTIKTIASDVSQGYSYSTAAPDGDNLYLLKYNNVEKYDGSTLTDVTDEFTLDITPSGSQQMITYGFYYQNVFYNISYGTVMDVINKHIYGCKPYISTTYTDMLINHNNDIFTYYYKQYKHIIETNVSLDNTDINSYGIVCRDRTKGHYAVYQVIYSKDYNTITDNEYDTAVDTTNEILGEEV